MPMKTRLMRSRSSSTLLIIENREHLADDLAGGKIALHPERAVRQNWQFTAQPTWLDTQIVARQYRVPSCEYRAR